VGVLLKGKAMTIRAANLTYHTIGELVRTLVSVIKEKDQYLEEHSERVATRCVRFATTLGLAKKEIEKLYLAGLLHDIGMVYIPPEITQKVGKLTEDEMNVIKRHPIISEKIISKHNLLSVILPAVRHHHEAFDGSGYPDGIEGDELSTEAMILALVNAYESMVFARPNRPCLSRDEALEFIENASGQEFEPMLASDFVNFIRSTEGSTEGTQKEAHDNPLKDMVIGIVKKIKGGKIDLPVLPAVVQEIHQVMSRPNATVDEVGKVIEKDGVISLRLISTVNSPIYRGTEKIYGVRQAIARLGIRETQSIVTTIANKSLYETSNGQFKVLMERLWLHSLACAYASRSIAKQVGMLDGEIFFLMGLLHDVGKAPLLQILSETVAQNGPFDLEEIAHSLQDVHTSFGGALLKRWGFPQDFNRIAIRHEGPRFSAKEEKPVLIVNVANSLVRNIGYSLFKGDAVKLSDLESLKMLDLDLNILGSIGDEVLEIMQKAAHIF
jgi:putative nucleotidyltransferase with HDIG domain